MWRILLIAMIIIFATVGCTFFGFLVEDSSHDMVATPTTDDPFALTATSLVRGATLTANTPQTYEPTVNALPTNTTPDYGATATELALIVERTLAPFRTGTAEYFLTQDMTPTFEAIPYR